MVEQVLSVFQNRDCNDFDLYTLTERDNNFVLFIKQKYINSVYENKKKNEVIKIKLKEDKYAVLYKNEFIYLNYDLVSFIKINNQPKSINVINEIGSSYFTNLGLVKFPENLSISLDFKNCVKIVLEFIVQNKIDHYSVFLNKLKEQKNNSVKINIIKSLSNQIDLVNSLIFMKGYDELNNFMLYANKEKMIDSLAGLYFFLEDKSKKNDVKEIKERSDNIAIKKNFNDKNGSSSNNKNNNKLRLHNSKKYPKKNDKKKDSVKRIVINRNPHQIIDNILKNSTTLTFCRFIDFFLFR